MMIPNPIKSITTMKKMIAKEPFGGSESGKNGVDSPAPSSGIEVGYTAMVDIGRVFKKIMGGYFQHSPESSFTM
jgi:hypothetical protein